MALIRRPEAWMAVMALSRPEPGPLTLTSTSLTPYLVAAEAAVSAARWAANGVLFRLPLKPTVPVLLGQSDRFQSGAISADACDQNRHRAFASTGSEFRGPSGVFPGRPGWRRPTRGARVVASEPPWPTRGGAAEK